ncbi:MAG: hypothetical protein IJQ02_02610 [Oscillospiraceae bacterium]|nr:hypothetical protein [Oscillospiraceae bacterium]
MKKTYETPKVEKLEFAYSDMVVASGGQGNSPNNDPNGQYYKCASCANYYAPGWGQNCS